MQSVGQVVDLRAARLRRNVTTGDIAFADIHELCAFLQAEIFASKMKYSALAYKCDCCPSTVSNIASGATREPRASTVFKILGALGFKIVGRRD